MPNIKIERNVVSQSSTESIRYVPHVAIEFVDKDTGKPVSSDSTFDNEDNVVAPGKTNLFVCITNPSRKFSGKGIVTVYATAPGASGVGYRISNVVRMEIDIDNKTAKLLEDILWRRATDKGRTTEPKKRLQ